jgi:aldose 1-epimerase
LLWYERRSKRLLWVGEEATVREMAVSSAAWNALLAVGLWDRKKGCLMRGCIRFGKASSAAALFGCSCLTLCAATVASTPWGQADGVPVALYTITSGKAAVQVTSYGARIVSIRVPNRSGVVGNVIVGRDSLEGYMSPMAAFMGATVGRYANRLAKGQFVLDGKTYQVPVGRDGNSLHGGPMGFYHKVWIGQEVKDGVEMTLVSPDGEMGFPGTMTVHVRFTLTMKDKQPALTILYTANSDKPTVVNLTNHAYFNLADDAKTSVMDDFARIDADSFTPGDAGNIPSGVIAPVAGTPLDFRTKRTIGEKAPERGYDNSFVLRAPSLDHSVAEVDDPVSGRTIKVFTTQPGLQVFVPRYPAPAAGAPPSKRPPPVQAFCLETQHFPDSPNHASFPSTVLRPGETFKSTTVYVFGVEGADGHSAQAGR